MLALLDTVPVPEHHLFKRLYGFVTKSNKIAVRREIIHGVEVMYITAEIEQAIKPRRLKQRLMQFSRALSREGASKICFSERFSLDKAYFFREGYSSPDTSELYKLLACQAIEKLPQGETVFFTVRRLEDSSAKALMALCKKYRYLLTDVQTDANGVVSDISRSLGVSVIEKPSPAQILTASAAVFMSTRRLTTELSQSCTVYAVSQECLVNVGYKRYVSGLDVGLMHDPGAILPKGFPNDELIAFALGNLTLPSDAPFLRSLTVDICS